MAKHEITKQPKDDEGLKPGHFFRPTSVLDRTFEISLILKGIDGSIEIAGAILLLLVSPQHIMHLAYLLTRREIFEDPNDFIAGKILQYAHELAGANKQFVILFLFFHGMIKIVLISGLLLNLAWAYPFAFITLGAFIIYQIFLMLTHPTIWIAVLTLFDFFIVWLTMREYQKYKLKNQAT